MSKQTDSIELLRLALVNAIDRHEFARNSHVKWRFLVAIEEVFELKFGDRCIDWAAIERAFEIAGDPK